MIFHEKNIRCKTSLRSVQSLSLSLLFSPSSFPHRSAGGGYGGHGVAGDRRGFCVTKGLQVLWFEAQLAVGRRRATAVARGFIDLAVARRHPAGEVLPAGGGRHPLDWDDEDGGGPACLAGAQPLLVLQPVATDAVAHPAERRAEEDEEAEAQDPQEDL